MPSTVAEDAVRARNLIRFAPFVVLPLMIGAAAASPDNAAPESAATGEQTSAPAPVADASTSEEDKMVCKRIAQQGSRLKQKLCMTQEQWDDLRRDSQDAAAGTQRNTSPGAPSF